MSSATRERPEGDGRGAEMQGAKRTVAVLVWYPGSRQMHVLMVHILMVHYCGLIESWADAKSRTPNQEIWC